MITSRWCCSTLSCRLEYFTGQLLALRTSIFYKMSSLVLFIQPICYYLPKWSRSFSRYAEKVCPKKVIAYLEDQKRSGMPARFYISGLILTEDAPYVVLHPLQNMRKMMMRALSLLLHWASEQRPGCEVGGVNILCCEFVAASQFCSLVIGLNYKLLGRAGVLAARPVCRMSGASCTDVID